MSRIYRTNGPRPSQQQEKVRRKVGSRDPADRPPGYSRKEWVAMSQEDRVEALRAYEGGEDGESES